jgi:uncharacterized membrane protein
LLKLLRSLLRWTGLLCVPGGVLWALSPTGIQLSQLMFHTPNVFWKLFASAPLLLSIGLVGVHFRISARSGRLERAGFLLALLGLVLIIAGNVGQFWLGIDDTYIMAAPAYRTFRLGLLALAVGAALLGVAAAKDGALVLWGALPFVIGALCGLVAFLGDLGTFGAMLWILFGVGWAWLGLALLLDGLLRFWRGRRARSSPEGLTSRPKPL